ncbi:MAG: host attachment protein [Gammaproteobacteria bacterium]|nr:host attachment protein [Gammaproteobacteria bacterium]MDH5591776.1 host attachment protein [Gammaproteobacteria bacterium]
MKSTMIVVADSSRARVFTADSAIAPLQEIETMAHPEGRLHEQNLVSDLPGKDSGQGGNAGGHSYQNETEPKQQQVIDFAKRVGGYLDDARKANKLRRLLLVAAPAFLGELRKQMTKETSECIIFELDKNLTQHPVEEIRSHLPKYLTH